MNMARRTISLPSSSPGALVRKSRPPLEKQIPDFGTFSGLSSILAAPEKIFSFDLDQNTFSKPAGTPISYYAITADNTPLPAWISFDPSRLSFSGRTPSSESLVQPPQRFALQVVASDVVGFAGAPLPIDIVVGNHRIMANKSMIAFNATPGIHLSYTGLRDSIKIDGKPATPQNVLIAATQNMPSCLSIDNSSWHITCAPPVTAESTNFTITLRDRFADTLNLTVRVELPDNKNGIFHGDLPMFTITAGRPFEFDLQPYLINTKDTEVSTETGSSDHWMQFNATTNTLFGIAPADLEDASMDVKITAKEKKGSKTSVSIPLSIVI